jgi:hypothetical protein
MWHSKTLRKTKPARDKRRAKRLPTSEGALRAERLKLHYAGAKEDEAWLPPVAPGGQGRRRDTLRLAEGGKAHVNGEAPQITGRPPVLSALCSPQTKKARTIAGPSL